MDHPRLPDMIEKTFSAWGTINGHIIGDFYYCCWSQPMGGSFILIGAPGTFCIGTTFWRSSDGANLYNIQWIIEVIRWDKINNVQGASSVIECVGSTNVMVTLDENDYFLLRYNDSLDINISGNNKICISRISLATTLPAVIDEAP